MTRRTTLSRERQAAIASTPVSERDLMSPGARALDQAG